MDFSGLEYVPVAKCCKHSHELSCYMKGREFLD
jgi:hypothetical protein